MDINKRNLPLIMMLVAGLVTVVLTFLGEYTIPAKLGILLAVLVVFYFVGSVIANVIQHFEDENRKKLEAEQKAAKEAEAEALAKDGNVEQKQVAGSKK